MRIAYTSTFDARDVHNWSGTPFHMSRAFAAQGADVHYIGSLKRKLPPLFKLKQTWTKYVSSQRESPRFNITAAKYYSEQAAKHIASISPDVIVSPLINPIAYLDCKQPIVLWTDALYAALVGFYEPFSNHSTSSIKQGNAITSECLARCKLAIFSSDWAANTAIELYGVNRDKVKVVPFGANIESYPSYDEIQQIIKNRSRDTVKLLFLAKSWERKGGDVVLAVAHALHAAGVPVELTIVGIQPPDLKNPPDYIKCLGYISKHDAQGNNRIQQLLAESHFLFVPSRAEAYGIVFCEANAFGLPCLTTYIGGIGTIVKDNINGMTFGLDTEVDDYCNYIVNVMHDWQRYETLAMSAYQEFVNRLNWKVSVEKVAGFIRGL